MGARLLCLCLLTALLGYYIYSPIPEELGEPWTVMLVSAALRAVGHLVRRGRWEGRAVGQGGSCAPGARGHGSSCVCCAVIWYILYGNGGTLTEGQEELKWSSKLTVAVV